MSNLKRFAEKYGLRLDTLVIKNKIHFNPYKFPGVSAGVKIPKVPFENSPSLAW